MEDKKVSDIQRINLIRKIASSDGLFGILMAVENELNVEIPGLDNKLSEGNKINQINYKQNNISEEKKENIEPVIESSAELTSPKEASIYREEARPLVEQDKLDHPISSIKEETTISNEVPKEDTIKEDIPDVQEHHKVLERTINNNPWAGIETVAPGQLKL